MDKKRIFLVSNYRCQGVQASGGRTVSRMGVFLRRQPVLARAGGSRTMMGPVSVSTDGGGDDDDGIAMDLHPYLRPQPSPTGCFVHTEGWPRVAQGDLSPIRFLTWCFR